MSSALDKSLDDIISSQPKKANNRKRDTRARGVSKKTAVAKKPVVTKKAAPPAKKALAKAVAQTIDASYATKVIVHGLPKDIKQDAIKEFFQSQVGGVSQVVLNYNEKGQSKGVATIVFKTNANAALAVQKYSGAPIDGGSSKLKLELIVDPSKKPLAARIIANTPAAKQLNITANKKVAAKAKKPQQKAAQPKNAQPKKENNKKQKKTKKTVEELDQEMADYFDN